MINNFEVWKKELFYAFDIAMHGHCDDELYQLESRRYINLINEVINSPKSECVEVLFRLFNNEPDYGIQESCFRVLTNIEGDIFIPAFLKELISLYYNAQHWCLDLFEYAVSQNEFFSYLDNLSDDQNVILKKIAIETGKNNGELSKRCKHLLVVFNN